MLRSSLRYFSSVFVASGINSRPRTLNEVTLNFRRVEEEARRSELQNATKGFFSLPSLLYPVDRGISPVMSSKQVDFIRNVYHLDALRTLNEHTLGSEYEGHPLDVVIRSTAFDAVNSVVHTAASEHFNHSFFFRCISPFGTPMPQSVANAVHQAFSRPSGDVERSNSNLDIPFERCVLQTALNHQAKSGWLYLIRTPNGLKLRVYNHGTCPLSGGNITPLFCINLHDHAYCIDYKGPDAVENYIKNCLRAANWNVTKRYLALAEGAATLDLLADLN